MEHRVNTAQKWYTLEVDGRGGRGRTCLQHGPSDRPPASSFERAGFQLWWTLEQYTTRKPYTKAIKNRKWRSGAQALGVATAAEVDERRGSGWGVARGGTCNALNPTDSKLWNNE
jgi:hypothetical protein